MINLILFLLIGLAAGWIAGQLMKGRGFGLFGNLVVGVVGAYIGGHLIGAIGFRGGGLIVELITAVVGAVILLFVVGLFNKS